MSETRDYWLRQERRHWGADFGAMAAKAAQGQAAEQHAETERRRQATVWPRRESADVAAQLATVGDVLADATAAPEPPAGTTSGPQPAQPETQPDVNNGLTKPRRKRPRRYKDDAEYLSMMRRLLRAYGRRIELADPTLLSELIGLEADLRAVIDRTAVALHEGENGFSWGEMGRQLGMTRQAAYQRWGKPRRNDET